MIKKIIKRYYKPTPIKFRAIGDAMLAASLFFLPYDAVKQDHGLTLVVVGIGIIGKFITNLFETKPND
jgi:hypothetical protein